ncbi:MAG: DUF1289 domain-containing protein [Henriciella sp.]
MTQTVIETPCIKVCAVSGDTGICLGCGRSLQEIGAWAGLTPQQRREIMDTLPARMQNLQETGKQEPSL